MAISFALRVFARNLLRENRRIAFCVDVCTGARTLAFRLISQRTTYYSTAIVE